MHWGNAKRTRARAMGPRARSQAGNYRSAPFSIPRRSPSLSGEKETSILAAE